MAIPARLKSHLDRAHVGYTPVSHVPTMGSQYSAMVLHGPGKEVAKTVALHAGEENILAVLPASYRINLKKLSAVVGKPIALLDQGECDKLFPDCEPGAVPPFGELYDMPVYLDDALAEDPEIIFSAGTRTDGVRMGSADFVRLAKPCICSFAEKS
jgi:Ala-tRNA(Pro) deacylase